jgi:hypothetical protein
VKRPILGLLAAATLSFGIVGTAPAGAAAPSPTTATGATPAHGDDDHGRHDTRRHGGYQRPYHGDDDHDGDRGRRRKCDGLIVVCLG